MSISHFSPRGKVALLLLSLQLQYLRQGYSPSLHMGITSNSQFGIGMPCPHLLFIWSGFLVLGLDTKHLIFSCSVKNILLNVIEDSNSKVFLCHFLIFLFAKGYFHLLFVCFKVLVFLLHTAAFPQMSHLLTFRIG